MPYTTRIVCMYLQAVREGLNKATAEVNAAASDEAKAEALIGLECYEALQKAIEG